MEEKAEIMSETTKNTLEGNTKTQKSREKISVWGFAEQIVFKDTKRKKSVCTADQEGISCCG